MARSAHTVLLHANTARDGSPVYSPVGPKHRLVRYVPLPVAAVTPQIHSVAERSTERWAHPSGHAYIYRDKVRHRQTYR